MSRKLFPSGRKWLLLLGALVVGIGVVWWMQPASDPMIGSKSFSDWAMFPGSLYPSHGETRPDDLRSVRPAAVEWLGHTVVYGRHPFTHHEPLPFDRAPDWLRKRVPERWGGLRLSADKDERVIGADLLCLLGPDAAPAIPSLTRTFDFTGEDDDKVQVGAALALHAIGPAAWPAIQKGLLHPNPQTRRNVVRGFHERMETFDAIAPPLSDAELTQVVEALRKACHDPEGDVRNAAIKAIYYTASEVHAERITRHLQATIPDIAARAGDSESVAFPALAWFREEGAPMLPIYTRMLEGDDPSLYEFAAEELHKTGPSSWPVVERFLVEGKLTVRYALVESIPVRVNRDDDEQPVPDDEGARVCAVLIHALGDPDPQMRALAAETIPGIDPPHNRSIFTPAIPLLLRLLAGPDVPVHSAYSLSRKQPSPDSSIQSTAMKTLASFGPKAASAIPQLIALLDNEQAGTRSKAARVLGKVDLEEKRSADRLRKMLDDPDSVCQFAAAETLEALGLPPEK